MSSSLSNVVKNILNPTPIFNTPLVPPSPSSVQQSPSVAPLTSHSDEKVDKVKDREEKHEDDEESEDEESEDEEEELREELQSLKHEKEGLEEELKVLQKDKLEMQEKAKEFAKREREIDIKTKNMREYDSYLIQHKKEVLDLLSAEKAQLNSIITGGMNAMLQLLNANNAITIGRQSVKPEAVTQVVEHVVATPTPMPKAGDVIVIDAPMTPAVSSHVQEKRDTTPPLKRSMSPTRSPKQKKRKPMTIPVRMPVGWGDEKKWKKHMEDLMWDEYSKYEKK